MTDDRWERIDVAASAPTSPSGVGPGGLIGGRPDGAGWTGVLRLRRDRRPVLGALDGGGAVLQRRLRDVVVGTTVLLVPVVALNLWVTVVAYDRFEADDGWLPGVGGGSIGTGVEDVAVVLATVFASITAALVGHFAAVVLVGERFRRPVALGHALRSTTRRLPVLLVAWAATHWWVPPMVAFVVAGTEDDVGGRLFVSGVVALFASTPALLVVPSIVGEDLGPWRAVRRSLRLVRLRFGSCLGFVVVSVTIGAGLLAGIGSLPALLETGGFITFGEYTWLVQGVVVQLGVVIVVPLVALGTAQLYVEIRLDAEGMDLVVDADAAFGPRRTDVIVS